MSHDFSFLKSLDQIIFQFESLNINLFLCDSFYFYFKFSYFLLKFFFYILFADPRTQVWRPWRSLYIQIRNKKQNGLDNNLLSGYCVSLKIVASILFLNCRAKNVCQLILATCYLFLLCSAFFHIYIPHMDDDNSEGYIIKLLGTVALTRQLYIYMTAIMHL